MTVKKVEKYNPTIPLNVCYMLKNEYTSRLHFKTQFNLRKEANYFFNDFKRKRVALSCSYLHY